MSQLRYTEKELFASHDYAQPQVEAGHRLHGGFDASGRYLSPRLLYRGPAIEAWTEALRDRGGELLPADNSLLAGVRFPSEAQQKLLLREGLGQTFWNMLTITGRIEARGQVLADMTFPEFQPVVAMVTQTNPGNLQEGVRGPELAGHAGQYRVSDQLPIKVLDHLSWRIGHGPQWGPLRERLLPPRTS